MSEQPTQHVSVLPRECLEALAPRPGGTYVDGTLGGAGHTRQLAERVGPDGCVISFDLDPGAIDAAEKILKGQPIMLVHENFAKMDEILSQLKIPAVDGILLDLGLSSDQIADRERGFSFDLDGPLDLRFDPTEGRPAWQLLEQMREEPLANLIYQYGEERFSRRIAKRIVTQRRSEPIRTSAELAELVWRCVPRSKDTHRIHPATRTFQALRIAVNDELGSLETILQTGPDLLTPGGIFAIISFHSLEDRRVKTAFREDDRLEVLTRKPIRPTDEEIATNPRSRSSRLRVARRV